MTDQEKPTEQDDDEKDAVRIREHGQQDDVERLRTVAPDPLRKQPPPGT